MAIGRVIASSLSPGWRTACGRKCSREHFPGLPVQAPAKPPGRFQGQPGKEGDIRMAHKVLDDLFHDTLKDISHAERRILKALPRMARGARLRMPAPAPGAAWCGRGSPGS
ncbi:DUF892 family protein [Paracoccus sp. MKU1]|uniref:DUF892 family protein n=1 Tax=Paracoccus sp. MKU1 TaxID=1745182 RepID=UPI0035101565